MKRSALAATMAFALVGSVSASASDASPPTPRPSLRQVVAYLESRYQGEVIAIALDDSGDKAVHYHVDMRYPGTSIARLDVDGSTLEIGARDLPRPPKGSKTLTAAAEFTARQLGGQVIAAELDSIDGSSFHYDIDVWLPEGQVARLKVDPQTQRLAWRTPPIAAD